jgi:hypothetical protein
MKTLSVIAAGAAFLAAGGAAQAVLVQYSVGCDDYVDVFLDGSLIMSYDAYPSGGDTSGVLDLSAGWHDLQIVYKNRWGSNSLWFGTTTELISLDSFRSLDASGNTIAGLRADYYSLNSNNGTGAFVKTVYGEGPIYHGWSWTGGPNNIRYQDVDGALWAGLYGGWDKFEERLSGQILVGDAVPEPFTLVLAGGALALAVRRARKRSA